MNRATLMTDFKNKFGGDFVKENGRWYWVKEQLKNLVSNGWLLSMLRKETPTKEVPLDEIPQHTHETVVEDTRNETSVEKQESKNETPKLSEEELKKEKEKQKRKERRAKKKLEKQQKDVSE